MMQFKPELIEKILAGEKTQTRRPLKQGDWLLFDDDDNTLMVLDVNDRLRWATRRTYAICPGRGKPQVARFKLLWIRKEDVREISVEDAIAEGFNNTLEFLKIWCGFYDPSYMETLKAEAHLSSPPGTRNSLWLRPDELYQAWALRFELVEGSKQ